MILPTDPSPGEMWPVGMIPLHLHHTDAPELAVEPWRLVLPRLEPGLQWCGLADQIVLVPRN